MARHYCYIYYDRGIPCYVGKGTDGRLMQHLGREDFPPSENLTVVLRPAKSSGEALRVEARLIALFGIRSKGGLLLNKVVPALGKSGTGEFNRQLILGNIEENAPLSEEVYLSFIRQKNLNEYTNMSAIARALGTPVCFIKKIVVDNPDLPKSDHKRALMKTIEVLRLVRPVKQLSRETRAALCRQNIHVSR